MTALDKLSVLMTSALERASIENLRPVSRALIPALPTLIGGLRDVILDPESTKGSKLRALEMLFLAWGRCVKADLRAAKAEASRSKYRASVAQAAASRAAAKVEDKKLKITEAKERRRIRKLCKQLGLDPTKKEGTSGTNDTAIA